MSEKKLQHPLSPDYKGKKVRVAKSYKGSMLKVETVQDALFYFQTEKLILPRNGRGNANGKEYRYVTLDDLINGIRPLLEKYKLAFSQTISGGVLVTTLFHPASKTELTSSIPLGNPANMQDYGSRVTYARRYSLQAMFGLSAEDDIDATGSTAAPKATEPLAIAPEPLAPVQEASETLKKAINAVSATYSLPALDLIEGKVNSSVKLTDEEKNTAKLFINKRRIELQEKK